jgi:hypothetical protein
MEEQLVSKEGKSTIKKKKTFKPKEQKELKFDFNDILIEPAKTSDIISRSEINIKYGSPKGSFGHLPLIAAPMDTVVSLDNLSHFMLNSINACLPRGEHYQKHGNDGAKMIFNSYSLIEFTELFISKKQYQYPSHVLIDIANGHMSDLVYVTKKAKEYYGKSMQLMVGNIANPETYKELSLAGADFIRCGIGNGCFIGGTEITTDKGYKNIEDIKIGEKVLTHKGVFKTVLNTKKVDYIGDVVKINDNLTCTPDHKLYVLDKKNIDIVNDENIHTFCEWISAEEILKNPNYLLIEHDSSSVKYEDNENKL